MIERVKPALKPTPTWDDQLVELEALLVINEHALEEASRDQPDAFYRVSKLLAILISHRDEAKQDLATVESEVDLEIRREAREYDEKVTEGEVTARKKVDKRVLQAQKNHNFYSGWVGQFSALKEAFQQRSYALNHLIELHLSSYFGEVGGSPKLRDKMREVTADRSRRAMADQRRSNRED